MLSQRVHYVVHLVLLALLVFVSQYKIPHHQLVSEDQHPHGNRPPFQQLPQRVFLPASTDATTENKNAEQPLSSCSACPSLDCPPCKPVAVAACPPPPQSCDVNGVVPPSVGTLVENHDIPSLLMLINQAPVRNADKFQLEPGFVPLVLRVHREELVLFQLTLKYYKRVIDISKTMLVISFDALLPELLEEALTIDFCQVKVLLAPSGHWMQNKIPGNEPGLPDARDQYGNPRSWLHSAIKHHFWWQTVTVWEHIAELKDVQGDMCFAEADHWPLPDYYLVAKAFNAMRDDTCKQYKRCFGSNLGGTPLADIPDTPAADAYTQYTFGPRGNMGMCYPRSTWKSIKAAAYEFCHHDDYNWDETLMSVALAGKIPVASLVPVAPRLVHVTHCGFHTKKEVCKDTEMPRKMAGEFERKLTSNWPAFRADAQWQHLGRDTVPLGAPFKGWGGWAHPADIDFCMSLVKD